MKNLAIVTTIVLCVACSQPNESDNAIEIESIRAQLLEIAEMSSVDRPIAELTDEYMTYFSKEPTLLPANGGAIHGQEAIAAFYNDVFDGIKILSNQYENPVIVVSDDMATRRYIGTAVFIIAGEADRVTAKNRYVDILVKENGEWKMLWHSFVPVSWE
jgi:ketosteroid isomerase-like protein